MTRIDELADSSVFVVYGLYAFSADSSTCAASAARLPICLHFPAGIQLRSAVSSQLQYGEPIQCGVGYSAVTVFMTYRLNEPRWIAVQLKCYWKQLYTFEDMKTLLAWAEEDYLDFSVRFYWAHQVIRSFAVCCLLTIGPTVIWPFCLSIKYSMKNKNLNFAWFVWQRHRHLYYISDSDWDCWHCNNRHLIGLLFPKNMFPVRCYVAHSNGWTRKGKNHWKIRGKSSSLIRFFV